MTSDNERVKSIRGFADTLPATSPAWRHVERVLQQTLEAYGYEEIRLPALERTELFARSIGEVTDIVEKEMYTFEDRNGDSLSLRPEGTAGCVRAGIQHGMVHGGQQRLWYAGPMFRHERPQKGRYRQFHQIGAEVFGLEGPDIDAEMILMTGRMLRGLGLDDIRLEINSLGSAEARRSYRDELVAHFRQHWDQLDDDARRRLDTNPMRVLDSKNPEMAAVIDSAPRLLDALDEASRAHFEQLKTILDEVGQPYTVNPRLVRGLDYYGRTVFEWVSDALGAQGTVCAGGRYDRLVEQIGGRPTPAIGFAMGLERLVSLIMERFGVPAQQCPDAYLVVGELSALGAAHRLAESLRDRVPSVQLRVHSGGGSFKSQFKRADRCGARYAVVLGEDEIERGIYTVKDLRGNEEQRSLDASQLAELLGARCQEQ